MRTPLIIFVAALIVTSPFAAWAGGKGGGGTQSGGNVGGGVSGGTSSRGSGLYNSNTGTHYKSALDFNRGIVIYRSASPRIHPTKSGW
jgi:hypothetical protein